MLWLEVVARVRKCYIDSLMMRSATSHCTLTNQDVTDFLNRSHSTGA